MEQRQLDEEESRERHTVHRIEIDNPVEVKFLDNNAHDIVLIAEQEARRAISSRQRELDEAGDGGDGKRGQGVLAYDSAGHSQTSATDDSVELLQTVEENGDQRIRRRVETKTVVSEDPTTKSKVTKVTKTETTEVTKVYLIRSDEDARSAALQLGVPDVSRIMVVKDARGIHEGRGETPVLQRLSWKRPRIIRSSFRHSGDTVPTSGYESEVLTADLGSVPQGEFVLVSSDGTTILQEPRGSRRSFVCPSPCYQSHHTQSMRRRPSGSERGRLSSICRCTGGRRKRADSSAELRKGRVSVPQHVISQPPSLRKRIQESTKKFSAPSLAPLVTNKQKAVIQHENLQLTTFIFDLMSKIGLYRDDAEQNRGRKVIARALDLLYYDRCRTWPEFVDQLWVENAEYADTNHVVVPTANVVEYVMTSFPDLLGLIDSIPDDRTLGDAKMFSERPFISMKAAESERFIEKRLPEVPAAAFRPDSIDDRTVYRDVDRAVVRDVDRAAVRDVDRAAVRDVDRAVVRDVDRAVVRDVDRAVDRDVDQTMDRESERSSLPTAHLLSVISDHDRLIPRHTDRYGESEFATEYASAPPLPKQKLPDVVSSRPDQAQYHQHICKIIRENEQLPEKRTMDKTHRRYPCGSKCLACFGDKRSRSREVKARPYPSKVPREKERKEAAARDEIREDKGKVKPRSESQIIEIPAVHWPTVGVGQPITYDTPDIILVNKQRQLRKGGEVPGAAKQGAMITQEDRVQRQIAEEPEVIVVKMPAEPDITLERREPEEEEQMIPVEARLAETVDILESAARDSLELRSYEQPTLRPTEEKRTVFSQITIPSSVVYVQEPAAASVYAHPHERSCSNIRNILECHQCLPRRRTPHHMDVKPMRQAEEKLRRPPHTRQVELQTPKVAKVSPVRKSERRESSASAVNRIAEIITCHKSLCCGRRRTTRPSSKRYKEPYPPQNICQLIRHHEKLPAVSRGDYAPAYSQTSRPSERHRVRTASSGNVCTRCCAHKPLAAGDVEPDYGSRRQPSKQREEKRPQEIAGLIDRISTSRSIRRPKAAEEGWFPSRTISIDAPSVRLPDIRLRSGRINIFDRQSLEPMRNRLKESFPGENVDMLLDEICYEVNRGQPLDKIRTMLIGRYPLAMIDLVLLSMSFVERDFEAGLINEDQVPQYLAKVLDDNRVMYTVAGIDASFTMRPQLEPSVPSVSIDTQTAMPAGGQTRTYTRAPGICASKCFPCTSEKKVTVPMSPDCIQILEGLQQVPSSQLSALSNRISERMRVVWELDRNNSSETSKVVKKILPKLRSGQVASLLMLRNDLKNENLKYFYVVDPCVDVVQTLAERYDISKGVRDADIDVVLHEVASRYAGVGLFCGSKYGSAGSTEWVFQPTNMRNLVQSTEQRIISMSGDCSLSRRRRKLTKIINDAYRLMAKRQVGNTTELRNQLHRLYPKDGQLVEYVIFDIEEGLQSGRLQHECGRCSIRILINILHSKDVESCRIDGTSDQILGERALDNLKHNKKLLASSIKKVLFDTDNRDLANVNTVINEEPNLDGLIDFALDNLGKVKSFDELKDMIATKCKHASTAELISLLLEQAYFANELEYPDDKDTLSLMKDRIRGKPLVLREICFALPDDSTIKCKDHRENYALTSHPGGKLISVGQGLTWKEANERARILFYRGRKPCVRYNDVLDGFDVRMLLEQDGCVHEIPVSPDDVRRLLNSCGLYWDGLNISLLGKSDEILQRAEQEAFKILRETGFLHRNIGTEGSRVLPPTGEPYSAPSRPAAHIYADENQERNISKDEEPSVESDR